MMTEDEIFNSVAEAIRDVLDEPDLNVTLESTSETLEGWDSTCQVRIVLALEDEFDVQFSADKIAEMTSVKSLTQNLSSLV